MARKSKEERKGTTTRILVYGCHAPVDGLTVLQKQLRLANAYGNKLVEIERARYERYLATRRKHAPDLDRLEKEGAALEVEIEGVLAEMRKQRGKEAFAEVKKGKRAPRTQYPKLAAQKKDLQKRLKVVRAEAKSERAIFDALLKPAKDAFSERKKKALEGVAGPVIKARITSELYATMLDEPEWYEAWKETARSEREAYEHAKGARATFGAKGYGLSVGNCGLVDSAVKQATSDSYKENKQPPSFKRYSEQGRVGGQVPGGEDVSSVMSATSPFVRFRNIAVHRSQQGRGRDRKIALVDIRAGTSADGGPEWVTFPVVLHRPLPPDASIRYAWVKIYREGSRMRYALQLTVTVPTASDRRPRAQSGAVALHLSWRQVDGGMRAGFLVCDDGRVEAVMLPSTDAERSDKSASGLPRKHQCGVADRMEQGEALRGYSDVHFDDARDALVEYMRAGGSAPAWLADEAEHATKWRKHEKLADIARHWAFGYPGRKIIDRATGEVTKAIDPAAGVLDAAIVSALWKKWRIATVGEPDAGDEGSSWSKRANRGVGGDLFSTFTDITDWFGRNGVESPEERMSLYLLWWLKKNEHLKDVEEGTKNRALRRRKDAYRALWSRMAAQYRTLVVCNTVLSEAAKRAKTDEADVLHEAARLQRVRVAPSELRATGKERFGGDEFVHVVDVKKALVASLCSVCGAAFSAAPESLTGSCANGHTMDRDENAARNMLAALDCERSGPSPDAGIAREAAE